MEIGRELGGKLVQMGKGGVYAKGGNWIEAARGRWRRNRMLKMESRAGLESKRKRKRKDRTIQ